MGPVHLRHWLRVTTVLAGVLLLGLAGWMRTEFRAAHAALDDRQASVLAIRAMQRACQRGERPREAELVAVAQLFPDARLGCTQDGDLVYLVFEREHSDAAGEPIVMQFR